MIEQIIEPLYFIRPLWLWAILPLSLILWWVYRSLDKNKGAWSNVIEAPLLKALSIGNIIKQSKTPFWLFSFSSLILIIALSGPSFFKYPHQTFKIKQTLFVVLDLSPSMNATDVKPSRVKRSIFAIKSLLKKEFPDEVSLVVFSHEPYLISPPTADKKTILSLIDGINTEILPNKGSNLEMTFAYIQKLINGRPKGKNNILLLTDIEKISKNTLPLVKKFKNNGTQISVIAIATEQGAPIPTETGLLKHNGSVVISKLNEKLLRSISRNSGGLYQNLYDTPNAIDNFLLFKQQIFKKLLEKQKNKQVIVWVDLGIWLSLLLIPFALLTFRRGYLLTLPLLLMFQNQPEAYSLFKTDNQLGQQHFVNEDYQKAALNFKNPDWKASSLYKAKLYDEALDAFAKLGQTYNEANALAKLGHFKKSIKKYQRIKKNNPNYKNVLENIKLLKKLLKKKKQQKKSSDKQQKNQNNKSKKSDKNNKNKSQKKKLSKKEKEKLKKEGKKQAKKEKKEGKKKKSNTKKEQKRSKNKKEKPAKKRTEAEVLNNEKKQRVNQELKKIKTKPYGLLQRKFVIERAFRQQEKSKFYNSNKNKQW